MPPPAIGRSRPAPNAAASTSEPKIALWPSLDGAIGNAIWVSLYAIYGSLVLAAAFGAGRDLPIAGGGISTTRGKQIAVTTLMGTGSIVVLLALAALLIGWQWRA